MENVIEYVKVHKSKGRHKISQHITIKKKESNTFSSLNIRTSLKLAFPTSLLHGTRKKTVKDNIYSDKI